MSVLRRLWSKVMRPDPRKCEEARALMSDYLDGELDAERRRQLERHVRFCQRCHTVLRNLRQTLARLRNLREAAPAEEDVDALAARIAEGWRRRA
jgi:anti-sigma factor RsiW